VWNVYRYVGTGNLLAPEIKISIYNEKFAKNVRVNFTFRSE